MTPVQHRSPLLPAATIDPALVPSKGWERWKYSPLLPLLAKGDWAPTDAPASVDILPDWASAMRARAPWARVYGDCGLITWGLHQAQQVSVIDVAPHTHTKYDLRDAVPAAGLRPTLVLIRVGEGGRLFLHDTLSATAADRGWLHRIVRMDLAAGASCDWVRVQTGDDQAVITDFLDGTLAERARCDVLTMGTGGRFCRHQMHMNLMGTGADLTLRGVGLLAGDRHGDTTITIEHRAPQCRSNQAYRHVVTDQAHGVFQGKVHVHQAGQQTDGYQLCNSILLSPMAQMNTKPELEIYADDVKCSHGTTTGQLDETPLFYMRSRGIAEHQARRILLESFLADIMDDPAHPLMERAREWLDRHVG